MLLIVTGPWPDTGTVVWVTPTSPPVSLLHPVTPSSVAARTSVADIARRRTTPEARGGAVIVAGAMVASLAFGATAVDTLFADATFKRWRQGQRPHEAAWTVALDLVA